MDDHRHLWFSRAVSVPCREEDRRKWEAAERAFLIAAEERKQREMSDEALEQTKREVRNNQVLLCPW